MELFETAFKHMRKRAEVFSIWQKNGANFESEEYGEFHNYGLSFQFVPATKDKEGYFCYLLSWGGPSEELRFFYDGRISFVYKEWFTCETISVSADPVFCWLAEELKETGCIDFDAHIDELFPPDDEDLEDQ
jgi:hypothetical protein